MSLYTTLFVDRYGENDKVVHIGVKEHGAKQNKPVKAYEYKSAV